ncbi:hypothetical protein AAAT94_12735 [Intestinimonas aquisgranensis]|nr:hypothetical protein [Intestinimonas aquisgranensis]
MGGPDEHLQSAGRGDSSGGAYQQLTLDLFLSEAEQIQKIDEAENVTNTFPAFSFAQKEIDHVLRLGGNTDHQRERIVAEFEKQKPVSEIAASLQALYHGGNGITTNTGSITAWYTEEGIRLSRGKSARYDKSAQVISWESAAESIGELLESGQFTTNVELTEAAGYKNLFLYTKMRNVAGLSTTDAQKSSDMFAKCRYMDEITGSRGVVFATGTPVSNSMTVRP